MSKEERKRNIKGFNNDFIKIVKKDIHKNINEVHNDTKYAGV